MLTGRFRAILKGLGGQLCISDLQIKRGWDKTTFAKKVVLSQPHFY